MMWENAIWSKLTIYCRLDRIGLTWSVLAIPVGLLLVGLCVANFGCGLWGTMGNWKPIIIARLKGSKTQNEQLLEAKSLHQTDYRDGFPFPLFYKSWQFWTRSSLQNIKSFMNSPLKARFIFQGWWYILILIFTMNSKFWHSTEH